jgi:hypothetical protein
VGATGISGVPFMLFAMIAWPHYLVFLGAAAGQCLWIEHRVTYTRGHRLGRLATFGVEQQFLFIRTP